MANDPILRSTQDFFVYVTTYIGQFPDEDEMTSEIAIDQLIDSVETALRNCRSQDRHHWLTLSRHELEQVRSCFNEASMIEKHMQAASEYFGYAVQRKKLTARFSVGPDGQISTLPNQGDS